ncbi:nibrin [Stomoxys calcitrans]|uniref:nibrin n=1 Tax=Stomoxys calcitrans TaxID=35570 RepID=UPI0027E3440D|nr:nibrin [Stomoxys calcitrans]
MWFITHASSGDKYYFSKNKSEYTVGRLGTDLELQNDICVSRSHAVFHVVDHDGEKHLELEDMGSKYGTFYNKDIDKNAPLEKGHKIQLKMNDLVRFGRLQNVWKVDHMKFLTVTSALRAEDVAKVAKNIKLVGGKVLEQWSSECTHLTMNTPTVTVKLLRALIEQVHIVNSNYWEDLANAVATNQSQLPKVELYRPKIDLGDGKPIDLGCKAERRKVFDGLTFVFLSRRHYETYAPIVKAAGGSCKDITNGVQKAFFVKNNVVVIQYIASTQSQSCSQTINEIADILQVHSRRIIPEYEIGLAIMYCSTEENCNPLYKVPESMPQTVQNTNVDLTETINTQSLGFEVSGANVITSTPFDNNTGYDKEDFQETMPNMCISETPAEPHPKKRKHINVISADSQDSDEELFQFPKKAYTPEDASVKSRPIKRSMFAEHNENSEPQNKIIKTSSEARANDEVGGSTNRKRPHIQVLGEEDGQGDEDDLFCFGDTQANKKKREGDEDLFAFRDSNAKEESDSNEPVVETWEPMQTQKFVVVAKPKKSSSSIVMPKPIPLPRKVSAIDWISGSLGKIKIKNENNVDIKSEVTKTIKNDDGEEVEIKTETANGEQEGEIKQEMNGELDMTEEHRKWLESLKDAIEIQEVSLHTNMKINPRSHYRYNKQNHEQSSENLNGSLRNFKTFVKKYKTPSETNSIQLQVR